MGNVGGFTSFREISKEEKELFEKVLNGLVGVSYKPLAVATQVVNGVNYAFLCDSKVIAPGTESRNDIVTVYKPISGDASITDIRTIKII